MYACYAPALATRRRVHGGKNKKCGGKAAQACAMRGHLERGRLLLESQRAVARLHNLGLDDLHDHAFQLVTDARTAESLKH